ncbi:MAG: GTP cyclohydrolase I FolE [candidate division Zixibacteria bacterium]|nr:GTP cyclohydrolase I FolE [candidate division Zixibacteria bacterium]
MKKKKFDRRKIIQGIKLVLEGIGEDIKREGLTRTPERIAEFYEEVLSGMGEDPAVELRKYTSKNKDEMIILKDISFFSLCEHHLLPFFGKVHICYIPQNNKMVGFSSMIKVVEILSQRLQVQERMTSQIADSIREALNAKGVLIVVEAEHLCLTMRGIKKPGSKIVTSAIRGMMRKDATRAEALALLERA